MARAAYRPLAIAALCAALSACGGLDTIRPRDLNPDDIADAVPGEEPRSAYGNPDSYVVNGKRYYTLRTAEGFAERGIASWYGNPFHGRRTSSGEVYDMYRMTAAHKQLPLPTYVQIRNLDNGRTATVKVNDRGPFKDNRVIDLSYAAALKLGVVAKGTAFVEIRAVNARGEVSSAPARDVAAVSSPAPSSAARVPVAPAPAVVAGVSRRRASRRRNPLHRRPSHLRRRRPAACTCRRAPTPTGAMPKNSAESLPRPSRLASRYVKSRATTRYFIACRSGRCPPPTLPTAPSPRSKSSVSLNTTSSRTERCTTPNPFPDSHLPRA
jgi:rare lipoprotein A